MASEGKRGVEVLVVNNTDAELRDDVSGPRGAPVTVRLEAGRVLDAKTVTWLISGALLVEMHHSLTLTLRGKDVTLRARGKGGDV